LSGRSQYVDINGTKSDALSLEISVIQGSILGPILFLCYINDFYSATTLHLFSVLFAEDTTCLGNGKKLDELTSYVNCELKKIANWFRLNKMAVNTSKTKFIVFRTRGKRIDPRDCNLLFNTNEIGKIEDPNLIYEIKRIHNDGDEKIIKLLVYYWTSIYLLMIIYCTCAQKFRSLFTALTGSKILSQKNL
jgi:hypothetical protein